MGRNIHSLTLCANPHPMPSFSKFRTDNTTPVPPLPEGACDCQIHVFGNPNIYPPRPGSAYLPFVDATIDAALQMHRTLGFSRGVVVQSTVHGADHRILYDALSAAGPHYRGVAIVTDDIDDRELQRLHDAGVRGARFNFWKQLNIAPTPAEFRRAISRISSLGWIAKIHSAGDEWLELFDLLDEVDVPIVVDHFGHLDVSRGIEQPIARHFMSRIQNENWWIMLSNGDRYSAYESKWPDSGSFLKAIIEAAPDRIIWSSDWPHVQYTKPMPTDTQLVELLYDATPDASTLKKVLVDNPTSLFGL